MWQRIRSVFWRESGCPGCPRRRPLFASFLCLEHLEPRSVQVADLDDSLSEAVSLGVILSGTQRSGKIDVIADEASDVDMFFFSVEAGQTLSFDIDRPSTSTLNSYLRLFQGNGRDSATELAVNDNGAAPGETLAQDAYVSYTFELAGTYYVGISGATNQTYSAIHGSGDVTDSTTGGYVLVVTDVDSDDQMIEAEHVTVTFMGGAVTGEIDYANDVDLFRLDVSTGQTLALDVDQTSPWNSYLRVFNSKGQQVAANDNGAAPSEELGPEPFLLYTFTTSGTYYLGISGGGNIGYAVDSGKGDRASSQRGSYTVQLSFIDLDDEIGEALSVNPILSVRSRSGVIETNWDVDMIKFSVTVDQRLEFDVDRVGDSTIDTLIRLLDDQGNEIASNDDGFAPGESTLGGDSYFVHTFDTAGTYYLGLSSKENSSYLIDGTNDVEGESRGTYLITITDLDPDDQLDEATSLGSPEPVTAESGAIDTSADVDIYQFIAVAGQSVQFDVDHASSFDSYLRLFTANGLALAFNDNGAAPGEGQGKESFLRYAFKTSGTYYLGISGAGNIRYLPTTGLGDASGSTGEYTLTVETWDVDDQITEAMNLGDLLLPKERSSSIEISRDVDMYRFSMVADQRVLIDVDHATGSNFNSFLRLFDAAGNEISNSDNDPAIGESTSYEAYLDQWIDDSGIYYVAVSSVANETYDPVDGQLDEVGSTTGPYTVRLSIFDEDDQLSEGISVGPLGGPLTLDGSIDRMTDVDIYEIEAQAGQVVSLDVDHEGESFVDSYLRLFDRFGKQLTANDNRVAIGEVLGKEPYVEYRFSTSGTYYVGISHARNRTYLPITGLGDVVGLGDTGDYQLTISTLDFDDTFAESVDMGTIDPYVKRLDRIDSSHDVDMYRFTARANQTLSFDIDRESGSTIDSYLRVFAPDGTQLSANDNALGLGETGTTGESYLTYTFSSSGTFYIAVSGAGNDEFHPITGQGDNAGSLGAYSLIVMPPPDPNGFQITLSFSGMTPSQQAIFHQAASIWSSVIVGDLPDVLDNGRVIDDVQITASSRAIDGVYGILGQAAPTALRPGSFLPYLGIMEFDSADLNSMEADGLLLSVILHEMGHVLGIGTIWVQKNLVLGAGGADPRFAGTRATAAFNRLYGRSETSVPLEATGGAGTRDSHWRETVFTNELMTGYVNRRNILSEVTIASLADLGYLVDLELAGTEF